MNMMPTYISLSTTADNSLDFREEEASRLHARSICHVDYSHTNAGHMLGITDATGSALHPACSQFCLFASNAKENTNVPTPTSHISPVSTIHSSKITQRARSRPHRFHSFSWAHLSPPNATGKVASPSDGASVTGHCVGGHTHSPTPFVASAGTLNRSTPPLPLQCGKESRADNTAIATTALNDKTTGAQCQRQIHVPIAPVYRDGITPPVPRARAHIPTCMLDLISPSKQHLRKNESIKTQCGQVPRLSIETQKCLGLSATGVVFSTIICLWLCWKYVLPQLFNHYT